MSSHMSDDMIMDLDLNQEPLDPPVGSAVVLGSIRNDLETTPGRIEDRIRQLEAVTARARLRQRFRQARNHPETSNISIGPILNMGRESGVHNGEDTVSAQESTVERGKSCKRDSSHLVAKALELGSNVKKPDSGGGGSFYDCYICLDMAKEPILTCCGHLFCWACFYQLPYVDSTAKECPACKGEVTDMNITPIYGNGDDARVSESESGLKLPPRPRAHRIESVRQQRVSRGISHIPVAEALRRIRIGIGATGEHPRQRDLGSVSVSSDSTSQVSLNVEAGGSRRLRSRQYSRVLSESAASLSSISSALNNAERLVEDLETYIHDRLLRRTDSQFILVDGRDAFTSNASGTQLEHQTADSTGEINSTMPLPSYFERNEVSASVEQLESASDTAVEINLTVPRPHSSSRRRSAVSRVSDVDNGVSLEPRRRRMT